MARTGSFLRVYLLPALLVLAVVPGIAAQPAPPPGHTSPSGRATDETPITERVRGSLADLPPVFIENRGQLNPEVGYYVAGEPSVYFTPGGVTVALGGKAPAQEPRGNRLGPQAQGEVAGVKGWALEVDFVGSDPKARPVGLEPARTVVNYLRGPSVDWRTGIPTYSSLGYEELWPGIDLVYEAAPGRLKYSFVVAPGADPGRIRLSYGGATGLALSAAGGLRVSSPLGDITDARPISYQQVGDRRVQVPSSYDLVASGHAHGFDLGPYDSSLPLVIDPEVLVYSTFLGGSSGEYGNAIAVDDSGAAYVTGQTYSADFPTTPGAFDTTYDFSDAFVTKLAPDGASLAYSTFLGGRYTDYGDGIVVDASEAAHVTGSTGSADFPTTPGAFDTTYNAGDVFVTKLAPDGASLDYSTFLGGEDGDIGGGIAVDASGAAYVTGNTNSRDFPTTPGAFDTTFNRGMLDAFVTKLAPDGASLDYSTFLGGESFDYGYGIAVDDSGAAYVTGDTYSAGFPTTPGAFDTTFNGVDAFVTMLAPDGASLDYSTFLGGEILDGVQGIAVDASGAAYVTGSTTSADFPTTPGAFDTTYDRDYEDAFVTKLAPDGASLDYSTFLGAGRHDYGHGIAVDSSGAAYVTGTTGSAHFPTTPEAFDPTYNGDGDAFVTKLAPDGASLDYSTFLGGTSSDSGSEIGVDDSGGAYVTGSTSSEGFPTTPEAFDTTFKRGDAFVTKLAIPPCTITGTPSSDSISGTRGADVICAKEGNDSVQARQGNDLVFGGFGHDTLVGGAGDDELLGEGGDDVLRTHDGKEGNDTAEGGHGKDVCVIDPGDATTGCEVVQFG